ncbi:MAG: hypothetical protein E7454_06835 [Ruminococcaceae bacterium]|nr:hypothetical protein [Oscillospiraceae bacterium]
MDNFDTKNEHNEFTSHTDRGADWVRQTVQNTLLKALVNKAEENNLSEDEAINLITDALESGVVEEAYSDLINTLSNALSESMENTMYEHVLESRAYTAEFLARQEQKWGKAFVASEALYLCILEATDNYSTFVVAEYAGEENYTYFALKNLHGRALQIYKEILCLNQNGFADGALARWRSLYELSVVACFINKFGEPVAQAYTNSVDSNGANEWARIAPCFASKKPKEKITLQELIDNSDIHEAWRNEYKFSNLFVHSSADATFYRLGTQGSSHAIPVGHTDWGMSLPATHAAYSLVLITVELFNIYPHGDSIAAANTFFSWLDRIGEFYKDVEDQCFSDINISDSENS